jgi:hypothetical protein
MATVNIGNIKFNWKGPWSNSTTYAVDDVVSLSGSSYISIQAGSNQNPASASAYWQQMSSAGTNGTNGTDLSSTLTTRGDIVYKGASALTRLPKGTAGYVLKQGANDPEWGEAAGGGVLQIKQALINSTNNFASTTYTAIPNFNITITPTAANSSFLLMATIQAGHSNNDAFTGFNFFDSQVGTSNGDEIFANGNAVSSRSRTFQTGKWGLNLIGNVNDYINWQTNISAMYTPSSNNANARTFHIAAFNPQTTVYMNHTTADGAAGSSTVSSIIVMEIANGIYS